MTVVQPVDAMSAEETRLADISTDSIIVFGPTGQIHYWNPAAESLFGWPAIAVVGRSISDLSLAADEDPAWRQLLQEGSWQGTIRRRNPRGENVEASVQIGRAHVCTPVTNAHLVCRLLLEKKKT